MKHIYKKNRNVLIKFTFLTALNILFIFPKTLIGQTSPHAFFDASQHSYIDFGKASSLTSYTCLSSSNKMSITLWVKWESKVASGVGQWANLFSMADSSESQNNGVFWIQHNSDNSKFEVSLNTSTKSSIQSTTSPVNGQWYHVALVYDGTLGSNNFKLYVNGVEEASVSKTGNIHSFPSKAKLNMGIWASSNNQCGFNGSIDEVSVWNTALSSAQINSIKSNPESITGSTYNASGLIAYYNFNDKKAEDLTTNSANGIPARNVVFWDTDSKDPFVYLTASDVAFCAGTNVLFKANARNNSSLSFYEFYVNNISKQNSLLNTYSNLSLVNGDKIHARLFSVPTNRGTIDTSFSIGTGFNLSVIAMAIQSDGKIILGGDFTSYNSTSVNYFVRLNADGSIDNTFTMGTGFNAVVRAIKIQSDGKILVAGNFTQYNGTTCNRIVRLNSDGTIDSGFTYGTGFNSNTHTLAIQSNGKILVGGQFTTYKGSASSRIIRLNTDGSLDTNFSVGSGFNNTTYSIEIQSDNKIIIGGAFTSYNAVTSNRLVRLNQNGTMDAMFLTGNGFDTDVYSIAFQENNKIVVGGAFTSYDGNTSNRVVRLNTDGSYDNTFSIGTGLNNIVRTVKTQVDDYILISGQFTTYNDVSNNRIVRVKENGSLDSLFKIGSGFNGSIFTCSYDSEGKIIAGGSFTSFNGTSKARIIRLMNESESKILTYTDTITVIVGENNSSVNVNPSYIEICRGDAITLSASGCASYSWSHDLGSSSSVSVSPSQTTTYVATGYYGSCASSAPIEVVVLPTPTIYINPSPINICEGINVTLTATGADSYVWSHGLGTGSSKTVNPSSTTKYYVTGTLFGKCPIVKEANIIVQTASVSLSSDIPEVCLGENISITANSTNAGPITNYVFKVNNNIVQSSTSNTYTSNSFQNNDVVKCELNVVLDSIGKIDPSIDFGTGFNGMVRQVVRQNDGKYLVIGEFTSYRGNTANYIMRINSDGSVDNSFSIGTGFNNITRTLLLQEDGKMVIVGHFTQYNGTTCNRIVRLNDDGSIDNTFNIGLGFNKNVYHIIRQNDGKYIVGGLFTTYIGASKNGIIRLNSDGSIDNSFDIGTGFGGSSYVYSMALQPDGKIIAVGNFTTYNGLSDINRVIRLNTDGSQDLTFNIGTGFNDIPYLINIQPDNKIMFSGSFTNYNGNSINRLIRVNNDGTIDNSFNIGSGFDAIVFDVVRQIDNKFIITGKFTNFNGKNINRILRLNNNGSLDSTFYIGSGFDNDGRSLLLEPNGNIIVGGLFSKYNETTANSITRLKNIFCDNYMIVSNPFIVNVNPLPNVTFLATNNPVCKSKPTTITAGSDIAINNWLWNTGNNTNQITISPDNEELYTVTATSTKACSKSYNYTVNVHPSPAIWITPPSYSICEGNTTTLSAYGASTYEWNMGLGSGIQKTVSPSSTTTYTVTATDANSCTSIKDVTVSVTKFDVTLTSSDTTFCYGKTVIFTASSPQSNASSEYDFWVNGVSVQKSTANTYTSSILNNGDNVKCYFTPNVIGNGLPASEFNVGTGLNGTARVIAKQNDGKFIVGGTFTNYNGSATINIVRINSDGTFDNTFSTGTGFDAEVRIIKIQPDNKIIVGGTFTLYNGTSVNRIVRLNADGTIDNTFNIGTGFNNNVNSIAIQTDGKIIISGEFTTYKGTTYNRIVRLSENGTVDAGFTIGSGFNNFIYALELQNDGKIIAGGNFTSYNGTSINRIARLNSNGSIDGTFSVGTAANNTVSTISIQTDGKIIIGGSFTSYNGNSINRIARINSNGSFDATYNVGSGFNNNVLFVNRLANNDIIVVGQFTSYKGTTVNRIARLESTGNLDTQFGGSGADNTIYWSAFNNDWKVYIAGSFTTYNAVSKNRITAIQNTNCYQQVTQSSPIIVSVNPNTTNLQINPSSAQICNGNSVSLTASGASNYEWSHTLGSGATKNVTPTATTTYTVTGTNLDGCFGTKTVTVTVIPIPETNINTFSPIVCSGSNVTLYASGAESYEWSNGLGFGNQVIVNPSENTTYSVTGTNSGMCSASSQIVLSNHKTTVSLTSNAIDVCGTQSVTFTATGTNAGAASTYKFKVNGIVVQNTTSNTYVTSSLTTNDTVDCELIAVPDNMGVVDAGINFGTGFNNTVYQIVRQSDGKYIVAGDFTTYKGTSINRIVRINTDGSIDNTFSVGTGFNSAVRTMILQSNNKIIIGGQFTTYNGTTVNRLVRLNSDGSIDNSFTIGTSFNDIVYSVANQADGKIIVGGQFTSYNGTSRNRIIRLNFDGSIDNTFSIGTGINNNIVYKVLVQADGKIVLVGSFTSYKGVTINRIIRLNSDGSADSGFNIGTGFNNTVYSIAQQTDGKYVLGGSFTTYNGTTRNRIVRINSDGTDDATYSTGTGFDNTVLEIIMQPDNKSIVMGSFITYTGLTRNRVLRLFSTGSIDNNFNIGTGFNGNTRTALVQPDGNIIIVGEFTTYKGSGINRIIRLKNTLCYEGGIFSNMLTSIVKSYPILTVTATPNSVCIAQEVSVKASSNIPISNWVWNTGNNTSEFLTTPLVTQTYVVTATSLQGCTSTGQVQVDVNTSSTPTANISISTNPICEGNSTVLTASGGTNYSWSNGMGSTAEITVSPSASTTYTVTVTNASGCTSTASQTVTVGNKPIVEITGTSVICQNQSTTLTASGGASYLWNTGATSSSIFTGLLYENTTYTVTVTNAEGCSNVASQIVTVKNVPFASISGNYLICIGQSTTLTSNGGTSYLWNTGNNTNEITVSPNANTTYTVTVTNEAGCSGVVSQLVTVMSYPIAQISGSFGVCSGQSTIITATGGSLYTWNNGATASSITISPTFNTTYSVTVSNAAGCTSTASQLISVNSFITPTITGNTSICSGQTTTLTASGGETYIWSSGETTESATVNPLVSTTYTVTASTASGCTGTASVEVSVGANLVVSISGDNSICSGKNSTLTVTGDGTYLWSTGQTTASIVVSPSTTTTYSVVVTNVSGCTGLASHEIAVNAKPTVSISGDTLVCEGLSTTLAASGGNTYVWSTGETLPNISVSPIIETNYSVTATNGFGCTNTSSKVVSVVSNIPVTISGLGFTCSGNSITLSASGSGTFLWSSGQTSSSISVSPMNTTTYTVTLTNTNGCTGTANHEVIVNAKPNMSIAGINTICEGQTTTLTVSGGETYLWSTSETNASINVTPLTNTTYYVTASNSTGCTSTSSYFVAVASSISISISPKEALICPGESITLTATGADTYTWSHSLGNSPSVDVNPSENTTYIVSGSTSSGCNGTAQVTVKVLSGPRLELEVDNNNVCNGVPVTFTASPKYVKNIPTINFYINGGIVQSSTSNTYTNAFLSNGDVVSAKMEGVEVSQGVLDEDFNGYDLSGGSTVNGIIKTFARQSDNKILIGGSFSQINDISYNRLARINTNGSLDTLFNIGSGFNNSIFTIQIQSDGKIIVGGQFTTLNGYTKNRIARLNANGTIDESFIIGNGFNGVVNSIKILSDGKILVGGSFTSYNGNLCNNVARLNPDGSFDSSFNIGTGFNGDVFAIEIQTNGKIIAGGNFTTYNGVSINRIVRLNSNGLMDATFTVGVGFNNVVYSIKLQTDGKILVGGSFSSFNGTSRNRIARLLTTGLNDNTFSPGTGLNNTVYSLALQDDDKIIVGGQFTTCAGVSSNYIARLSSTGSRDATFNIGSGFNNTVYFVDVISNDKFYAVGQFTTFNGSSKSYLAQIFIDGSINASYNTDYGYNNSVQAIGVSSSGSIYTGGSFTTYNDIPANKIMSINEFGEPNLSFNIGSGFNNTINSIAVQTDGKVIVGGAFTTYNGVACNRIVRLNIDGTIDNTFLFGGGFNNVVNDIVIQNDGMIIIGGNFSSYNGYSINRLIRLNNNGSRDLTFSIGSGFSSQIKKISVQTDGKIIVGGEFSVVNGVSCGKIVRLLNNGSVDLSFVVGNGFNSNVQTVFAQNDGKIVVGGAFTTYKGVSANRIARLNSDGSIDNSFISASGFNSTVNSVIYLPSNKYIVGGAFTSYNGMVANRIAKINIDGSSDTGFEAGAGFNNVVNTITISADGMLVVGGVFTTYQGKNTKRFAKITNTNCSVSSVGSNQINMIIGQPGCNSKSLQPIINTSKIEYCENESSEYFYLNYSSNGTITWQKRTLNSPWIDVADNSIKYFDSDLKTGYWEYRAILNKNSGNEKTSNSIFVNVHQKPKADFSYIINQSIVEFSCKENTEILNWNFGDGSSSNNISPIHNYENEGEYFVKLVLYNEFCSSMISKNIEIKKSIIEKDQFVFTVYPNPSLNGLFKLTYSSDTKLENVKMSIFDSFGKLVYSEPFFEVVNGEVLNFDLSKNSGGLYFMKIEHSKGITNLKLIIR